MPNLWKILRILGIMQLQVHIEKRLSMETLRSQIDELKGDNITYSLIDRDEYYALNLTYTTSKVYTNFMEKLHDLWR